ncbi:helix-hairpin-helix domain-containing protein [Rossellomorea aquimaris]|uniref:helix-hairpin-helix domain-containing protein n=1 Tax=Rossellomorea aquimaris TaxID=189382 RepID=UPI001CD4454D|nr:helix-hairpin-helix domain-containing protein [Rossellomorea aquimaris]MCA1056213.1 helix-hairpin-helix domain-containing protein [Rossellomorea aquimaris]
MQTMFEKYKRIFFILSLISVSLAVYLYMFIGGHQDEAEITPLGVAAGEPIVEETDSDPRHKEAKQDESVYVDLKGEVQEPGLYQVESGTRLKFVIDKAGGFTSNAESSVINLAIKVTDEMLIYVPKKGEAAAEFPVVQGMEGSPEKDKVNLNAATEEDFDSLPGIGPAKAATFVQYREENGPFKKIEDIKNISGIGEKTFEKLKEHIFVQ